MGFTILALVIATIAVIIGIKMFPHHITLQEGVVVVVITCGLVAGVYFADNWAKGADTMILNGQVTGKERNRVSCSHSYPCRCRPSCSGAGTTRSCYTKCDTCYEHLFDYDWDVYSSIGNVTINRVDRQGTIEPPRWTAVKIGEPFSKESSYYNFVKAASFSIFNRTQIESAEVVPAYIGVVDYYKIDRIVKFGIPNFDTSKLNDGLNNALRSLDPQKKANIVVVFHNKDSKWTEIVKAKSLGGKINDITIMIGLNKDNTFKNVNVYSWSKNDMVNVVLRDTILAIGKYEPDMLTSVISSSIQKYYVHRSIKEFEYLKEEIQVSENVLIALLILSFLVPLIGLFAAYKIDSGDEWRRRHLM